MRKRRVPHCAHASHFQHCLCGHERQSHIDEVGQCMERKCDCLEFQLAAGYAELPHETLA